MTVQELYLATESDYPTALRCLGDDMNITKWLLRLRADPCFEELQAAMPAGNAAAIERAANTLKGLCLNLGLTKLGEAAKGLEDSVKNGVTMATLSRFHTVEVEYAAVSRAADLLLGAAE
ncbi:MAG: Hpt domain-containing protein [Clostridia bacterium]|nr:Hpt domain-containing protein [Clostridia bacterium]MBQ3078333.1 Hpt domain-containing protein [Clostridia bacterium]